jgi:diacylglycerol kinase family enzyme
MNPSAVVGTAPLVCLINDKAGTAKDVVEKLKGEPGLDVRPTDPAKLTEVLEGLVASGVKRVAVSGGDGTLRSAAQVLAGTATELAVIPGGTLNHFAKNLDIPLEPEKAARLALEGTARPVDVGYVNERLILNTSSVGVYVLFVKTREHFEKRFGYFLSSLFAAVRILWRLRTFNIEIEVEGVRRRYETPLVFVGVGERELKMPGFGERVPDGKRGIHVFVVRGKRRARLLVFAIAAAPRGIPSTTRSSWLDAVLVEDARIDFPRKDGNVAVDGEIEPMTAPLEYRVARDALNVVVPG